MKDAAFAAQELLAEVGAADHCDDAPRYFPPRNGLYEVKAGFSGLRSDFGNGAMDGRVFQLDGQFARYRQAKLRARAERLSKYYQTHQLDTGVAAAACTFVRQRLVEEYPEQFQWEPAGSGGALRCALTGEALHFDGNMHLGSVDAEGEGVAPPYASAFDALACQVQADLNITCRRPDGTDWLAAIHVCAANHWAPEEKVGMGFADVHAVVAGIEPVTAQAPRLVRAMVLKGPFVRFAWGIGTDARLNHHPEPPPGVDRALWQGRRFDAENPQLHLRVEREVLWGLPEVGASLFIIRTSFRDGQVLRGDRELGEKLASAIESMTPASLEYKGLARTKEAVVEWLRSGR